MFAEALSNIKNGAVYTAIIGTIFIALIIYLLYKLFADKP